MPAPEWVREFQKRARWFKAANDILSALHDARDGGGVSKALAGITAFGLGLDAFFPKETLWEILDLQGYKATDLCIGGFLCEILMRSDIDKKILPVGLTDSLVFWEEEEVNIAAIYSSSRFVDGPYVIERDMEALSGIIQGIIWGSHSDLQVVAIADSDRYSYKAASKFRLEELPAPGIYVGKKGPEYYASRLERYGKRSRTVLIRGPTGVGKSVLARHIALINSGGRSRTLKIASSVLKKCRFDEVLALVRVFQPCVLLLDDLRLDDKSNTEEFLAILESIRDPNCLVVVTMMTTGPEKEIGKGAWHFDGMRPGRIDETITLPLPCKRERKKILQAYLPREMRIPKKTLERIAQETEGLSGAYLMEVARRIQVHGLDSWQEEVLNVICSSPPYEEGSDGGGTKKEKKPFLKE